tara:strand:- start:356 stop:2047 length:1692 start_codon:yes stop_codon:yes gene_type:complete
VFSIPRLSTYHKKEKKMSIVTISRSHNCSLCILENGVVKHHIENERLSRIKYDNLAYDSIYKLPNYVDEIKEIGLTGMYVSPKTEDTTLPVYLDAILRLPGYNKKTLLHEIFTDHHYHHACCSFYNSGFEKALCINLDGLGSPVVLENDDKQVYYGREDTTAFVLEYPNKAELIHRNITYPLGIRQPKKTPENYTITNSVSEARAFEILATHFGYHGLDAGKVMGMASYGKERIGLPEIYINGKINTSLFRVEENFNNAYLNVEDYPTLKNNDFQTRADFAHKLQSEAQLRIFKYIDNKIKETGVKNVCLSGGFFLNCVANNFIRKNLPKDVNLYVEPLSSDSGTAMGIAKAIWHGKQKDKTIRKQKSIYYGFKYDYTLKDLDGWYDYIKCDEKDVVKEILNQKVVGLYQGQSEQGPRALGNRSILFDPRNKDGKDIVNKIKKREWFRPFAGTVLKEHANKYFDIEDSPFMMYAVDVKTKELPCITHIDNTCRVQTLEKDINPVFYNLINEFYKESGIPVLLNTSFNIDGEPIVETLEDALKTFNRSALDVLYLPDLGVMIKK